MPAPAAMPPAPPVVTSTTSSTEPLDVNTSTTRPAAAGRDETRTVRGLAPCWNNERCSAAGAVNSAAAGTASDRVMNR